MRAVRRVSRASGPNRSTVSRPSGSRLRDRLEREIETIRALQGTRSRWSEQWSYRLDGREVLHFHGESEIDLRLTRQVIRRERERLAADPRLMIGARERD